MMKFKVPKYLEREAKIISFLTFKQLAFVGGAGVVLLILYYLIPISLFIPAMFIIGGVIFSFLFLRFEGIPLSQLMMQSFGFFFSPRTFLWQQKRGVMPIKLVKKKEEKAKKREITPLKVAPESKLKALSSKISFGLR